MTLRCLCAGTLVRAPERKSAANGKPYCRGMVRIDVQQRQEGDPDSQLVFVIAFGDTADALLELKQGDSIAFAGKLDVRATIYQDRPQATLNVVIDKLIDGKRPPRPQRREATAKRAPASLDDDGSVAAMVDDVPFG